MLDLSFEGADGYLIARIEGQWTPDAVCRAIGEFTEAAHERGYSCVLLDIRKLSAPRAEFHRYLAGTQIAEICRNRLKVAAVYPAELINKFAEDTAVNRGASLIVLPDLDEAVRWLMESPIMPSTVTV